MLNFMCMYVCVCVCGGRCVFWAQNGTIFETHCIICFKLSGCIIKRMFCTKRKYYICIKYIKHWRNYITFKIFIIFYNWCSIVLNRSYVNANVMLYYDANYVLLWYCKFLYIYMIYLYFRKRNKINSHIILNPFLRYFFFIYT